MNQKLHLWSSSFKATLFPVSRFPPMYNRVANSNPRRLDLAWTAEQSREALPPKPPLGSQWLDLWLSSYHLPISCALPHSELTSLVQNQHSSTAHWDLAWAGGREEDMTSSWGYSGNIFFKWKLSPPWLEAETCYLGVLDPRLCFRNMAFAILLKIHIHLFKLEYCYH